MKSKQKIVNNKVHNSVKQKNRETSIKSSADSLEDKIDKPLTNKEKELKRDGTNYQ